MPNQVRRACGRTTVETVVAEARLWPSQPTWRAEHDTRLRSVGYFFQVG